LDISGYKTEQDFTFIYSGVYKKYEDGVFIEEIKGCIAYAVKEKYIFENYYFAEDPNNNEGSPNYVCKLDKIYSYSENGQDKYTIHPELLLNDVDKVEVPIDD
jgi:hypothetical protein